MYIHVYTRTYQLAHSIHVYYQQLSYKFLDLNVRTRDRDRLPPAVYKQSMNIL